MYPTFTMIASLVEEKETRVREVLRMMGVSNWPILCSWFLLYATTFAVLNVLLTLTAGYSIFEFTSNTVLFAFFTLYSWSVISFGYFIHVFFDKARTGGITGALIFNCCYFVYAATFDFSEGNVQAEGSLWLCLLAPATFGYGISIVSAFEEAGQGAQWSTISEDVGMGLTVTDIFTMLAFDSLLYSLLGWYLDQVLRKEYGVTKKWYFPVQDLVAAWQRRTTVAPAALLDLKQDFGTAESSETPVDIEEVGIDLRQQREDGSCVMLRGLRKVFNTPDGPKTAVHGLHVDMYQGQIFVLLGCAAPP